MIDRNEYDPVVEEIHKIRRKISKKIENMSLEERNEYFKKETEELYKAYEKYKKNLAKDKNTKSISLEVLMYYKSIAKDNYMELINDDLKRVIEFRKSLWGLG